MLEVWSELDHPTILRLPMPALLPRRLSHFNGECTFEYCSDQAMEYLPAPSLRRILHLQNELVSRSSDLNTRALLSSSFGSGSNTPRHERETSASRQQPTSGSTATDLLLGVTGRNKLLAAGDRLRELIIPDALAQAVTVGVGGGKKPKSKKEKDKDDTRAEAARSELDELVAGSCPLCEGSVVGLDKPFIADGEDVADWVV